MDTHTCQGSDSPAVALERLEASIEEMLHRLIDGGRIDTHHRASVEGFRRRLADLRQRLSADEEPAAEMPPEVQSDFDLLAWDYKRWIAGIDREFESPAPHPSGLGRGAP